MFRILLVLFTLLITIPQLNAQKKKKKKDEEKPSADAKIKEKIKGCVAIEGLFTFYQDTIKGDAYWLIKGDQLKKEFIYAANVIDGPLDAGYPRGSYWGTWVFTMEKYMDKIEIYKENTSYYFDPENALSKAAQANINRPLVASIPIEASNADDKQFLLKANDIFLKEVFTQIKRSPRPGSSSSAFKIGNLNKDKTKFKYIRSYDKNSIIGVKYVYSNPAPINRGSAAITDARNISIQFQHSFIEMPDDEFEPRKDDGRIGYFMTQVTDQTSVSSTPYRDMINRWRLIKEEPGTALSEPVEPITWWIENTTPEYLRETIKEGVEAWNIAFEKAGFRNAIVCKIQPDTATWDAGDIEYNVLRWTSSSAPPWGGYGPSFKNPRTGEIVGSDIMLEFVYITNRLRSENLFDVAGTPMESDVLPQMMNHNNNQFCQIGTCMHHNNLFGFTALRSGVVESIDESEFVKQSLKRLVLHEVGHTLGLNHNFRASTMHSYEDIINKEITMKEGLTASVMDYPMINIPEDKTKQGHYFDIKPGVYDQWAIEYGYSEALDNEDAEVARLEKILSQSTKKGYAFANDADDMRSPGRGIDPRNMIFDISGDPIDYAADRLRLVERTMNNVTTNYVNDGEAYNDLRIAYFSLTGQQYSSLNAVTRTIGGIYQDRSLAGTNEGTLPLQPVPMAEQKRAMNFLAQHAFAPNAFSAPSKVYNYMLKQRRGFNHRSSTEDPKIHERVLRLQGNFLRQLLHANTMQRITNTELYGNQYDLATYMNDLTDAIIKADVSTDVNTTRQNLQIEYIKRLSGILVSKTHDNIAKSNALYQLKNIQRAFAIGGGTSAGTKAHRAHALHLIEKALDED